MSYMYCISIIVLYLIVPYLHYGVGLRQPIAKMIKNSRGTWIAARKLNNEAQKNQFKQNWGAFSNQSEEIEDDEESADLDEEEGVEDDDDESPFAPLRRILNNFLSSTFFYGLKSDDKDDDYSYIGDEQIDITNSDDFKKFCSQHPAENLFLTKIEMLAIYKTQKDETQVKRKMNARMRKSLALDDDTRNYLYKLKEELFYTETELSTLNNKLKIEQISLVALEEDDLPEEAAILQQEELVMRLKNQVNGLQKNLVLLQTKMMEAEEAGATE